MHIEKEATISSKIEGMRTNIEEVFLARDEIVYALTKGQCYGSEILPPA